MSVRKKGLVSEKKVNFLFIYYNERHLLPVREYAKKSGISKSSASVYLRNLQQTHLSRSSISYKLDKSLFELGRIVSSGLIDFLVETLHPSAIILFGSMQKGEYTYSSDIDIYVETYEKDVSVKRFEQFLNRPIQLFLYSSVQNVSHDLRTNIINGYTLYGGVSI